MCKTSSFFLSHILTHQIPTGAPQTATDRRDSRCNYTYQYRIGPRPFSFPSALCSLSSPHTEESTSTLHSSDTHSNTSDEAGQRRGRARRIGLPLHCFQKAPSAVQQTFEVVERVESHISQRLQGDDARCHKNHSIHKNNKNKKMHIRFPGMHSRR